MSLAACEAAGRADAVGFDHKARDNLHGYWDTQFVDVLGRPPAALAKQLLAQIKPAQEVEWRQGTPDDWAMEAFNIAFTDAYGDPPLSKNGLQDLDTAYVERAKVDVALQLSRAGIRLALVAGPALLNPSRHGPHAKAVFGGRPQDLPLRPQ